MSDEITPELKKLLDKAKIGLMQKPDSTFFTTILFGMKFKWDSSVSTAYTNGLTLGFSPVFFQQCTPDERIGVLVHECCHVAYQHIGRTGSRDHKLFNVAADHVINLMLLERNFKLPVPHLADIRFKGLSTEQVYDILLTEQKNGAPSPQLTMADLGHPDEDKEEMATPEMQRKIDDIIIRAVTQSKMSGDKAGSVPGDVELYLDQLLNPKLPWQSILRKWLKSLSKSDYSWKRPNRRFMPNHYLPSLYSEGAMTDFQAWVDISGSETDEDFLRFVSELNGILKMMKPKKIELGQFDTEIKSIDVVRNVSELADVKFSGRGSTRITDVLDHIEKTKPKVAMIFTDGGFYMDRDSCNTNVLWMIHDNDQWTAPFGKVIHYNTHD